MSSSAGKNPSNVAGGLKAAIHNPNVSEEAKESAKARLEEMGTGVESTTSGSDAGDAGLKNEGNVIGGYKATLKNPNVSDEAKQHAEQVLRDKDAI
ncbi:hypothetical protein BDN72DRAFT_960877 [Pluteus cervinus]|uniref:Uncharacterized protein n=1 Tax=Pluteus cervinus TaxID=181527 RepID=A0ACD3ANY0_9AGAR|nr:hypothetical protein BDN72DRAFT_960877 [Pluteus cervinus]